MKQLPNVILNITIDKCIKELLFEENNPKDVLLTKTIRKDRQRIYK